MLKFYISILIASMLICGCGNPSQVKKLSEKEIAKQEQEADIARDYFFCGNYQDAIGVIEPLCVEMTTSQPLYLCELGTICLAENNKEEAKDKLMQAYKSIQGFFDPKTEKEAVSLWGAESSKVFKGEPHEQATLSMLMGLLLLEEGDVDNAIACIKTGQIADSDSEKEQYKCDYALLQFLEALCYSLQGESDMRDRLLELALNSFISSHPKVDHFRKGIETSMDKNGLSEDEQYALFVEEVEKYKSSIETDYLDYCSGLGKPFNTLVLVWSGSSPVFERVGDYGEERVLIKSPVNEIMVEAQIDSDLWYDAISGVADIGFQASTRGGREMDNVLASQAQFKSFSHNLGNAMFAAAGSTDNASAQLVLIGAGLISHGIGAATNVKADIRSWKMLPDNISVIPLNLTPGVHKVRIDCYDNYLQLSKTIEKDFVKTGNGFQFYNIVVPCKASIENNAQAEESSSLNL